MQDLIARIDKLKVAREQRLTLERSAKILKQEEDAEAAHIIQLMNDIGVTELNGVSVKTSIVPVLVDWSKLEEYIRKYDAVDLLQKRLTPTAVRLRWQDGIDIPGVDRYEETKLAY